MTTKKTHFTHLVNTMGTVVTLDVFTYTPLSTESLSPYFNSAALALCSINDLFSTFIPSSPMSQFIAGHLDEADLPKEITEVLALSSKLRDLTRGYFDPWALPLAPDPTGLVKGYAASVALLHLNNPDFETVIVNAAGDIAVRSPSPIKVGVTDPTSPHNLLFAVQVKDAIATSSDFLAPGHLFDPLLARPSHNAQQATVTGPDLATADALATALCVAGPHLLDALDDLPDYEAALVTDAGLVCSPGFSVIKLK